MDEGGQKEEQKEEIKEDLIQKEEEKEKEKINSSNNENQEEDNYMSKKKEIKKVKEERKWFNIGRILIGVSIILLIVLLIVIATKTSNDDNNEEEKEEQKEKWTAKGERIKTIWGEKLNPDKVWPEYPRPQMVRDSWKNLNGLWDYYLLPSNSLKPEKPQGQILVPFPIESSLSGVMKTITNEQELWYQREVEMPQEWKDMKILLHFGAVDWRATVYVNFKEVGVHEGGYVPFYFDITNVVKFNETNIIIVKVYDPTDKSYIPVGKQTVTPAGIWYTAVSGIWQTVWMEPVQKHYINKLTFNNDFDYQVINVTVHVETEIQLPVEISIYYKGTLLNTGDGFGNQQIPIPVKSEHFHPWSPDSPNLYDVKVKLLSIDKKTVYDNITSYTAIRKVTKEADSNGKLRIKLNGKVLFNMGTLDQGWFPDGLYTPASEEAMIFDIQKLKDMGFNTIRKHIKVESARYYYNCDKIGMILWQDMPAGDVPGGSWDPRHIDGGKDKERTQESKDNYYKEWTDIIEFGKFFQCITIWIPFNENWGQFDTETVVNFTRGLDSTRLINSASGGNHRVCGDILDLHNYPAPEYYLKLDNEINVLGEYGGLGLEIKNHTWKDDNWGYAVYKTKDEITAKYVEFIDILINQAKEGFSAAIYTQTTDVESEINGLITYDRKEMKVYEELIKQANKRLIDSLKE